MTIPIDEAFERVLSRVDARAEELAARMQAAYDATLDGWQLPEHDRYSPQAVHFAVRMMKARHRGEPQDDPEMWRRLGTLRADQGIPLPTVLLAFQVGMSVVLQAVVEEALTEPDIAAGIIAACLQVGFDMMLLGAAEVTRAYDDSELDMLDRHDQIVRDLVVSPDEPSPAMLEAIGLHPDGAFAAVAVRFRHDMWRLPNGDRRRIDRALRSGAVCKSCAWTLTGGIGCVIIGAGDDSGEKVEPTATRLAEVVRPYVPDGELLVVAGGVHSGAFGLGAAYHDAVQSLRAAEKSERTGVVLYPDARLTSPTPAKGLAANLTGLLRPLADLGPAGLELVATLRIYLETGMSVKDTADSLGLPPDALEDRLRGIEELLHINIAEQAMNIELALLAFELNTGPADSSW